MRVVVHEPTLSAAGAERVGAVVLAAVRAAVRAQLSGVGAGGAADDAAAAGGHADDAAGPVTPP